MTIDPIQISKPCYTFLNEARLLQKGPKKIKRSIPQGLDSKNARI